MSRLAMAAAAGVLALVTYFQFPGHTWLQQDSQIYLPILEHLRDPSVLRNEMLAGEPHVAYTLYDEAALFLRGLTGLGFRAVLALQQVVTRALGIWGLMLIGAALLRREDRPWILLLLAGIASLGALIPGPMVLLVEYEPTPRAFALPLLLLAVGFTAQRRYLAAGIAAGAAFLYHPPTALPFYALYVVLIVWPGRTEFRRASLGGLAPLLIAAAVLLFASREQAGSGAPQVLFGHLTALQEQLQRMRASYVWVSMWPPAVIAHHAIVFGALAAAAARLRRDISLELGLFLVGLPILGIFSMPASWLLLERWKWALVPQLQPMRSLLFVSLSMVILTTAAGLRASTNRQRWEAAGWFTLAFVLPLDSLLFGPLPWRRALLAVVLGVVTAGLVRASELRAGRLAPAAALAPLLAFFAIPAFGDVENYPDLHTAGLRELSEWARTSTAQDAVFLFPDAGRSLEPGMFRSDALRAVYVDWKGGGQVNFLRSLGERWWERWQKTMAPRFRPALLAGYRGLGIDYVVLRPEHRLGRKPVFENRQFVAYAVE